ncbi:cysteine-rich protein 2-binding protein-like isoform X2 [Varroa jacobsoni]|nr:cysteine-rich protein 2-binding protein-like isoform X2 [Varroa jacobsoni]
MDVNEIPLAGEENLDLEEEFIVGSEDNTRATESEVLDERQNSVAISENLKAEQDLIANERQSSTTRSNEADGVELTECFDSASAPESQNGLLLHKTPSRAALNDDNNSSATVRHCYCQTTNIDPLSMVVCEGCGLYFHQDCFHKGRFSSLLGDKFFEFLCESCGSSQDDNNTQGHDNHQSNDNVENPTPLSKERIVRKPHTWVTAVALALFNLHSTRSHESRQGYFQWREQVCRYIEERWNEFFFDRKKAPKWQGAVACTLSTNTGVLFQSGVSEIDEQGWWKLIENVPPDPKNPTPTRGRRRRGPSDDVQSSIVELGPRIRKRPTFDGQVQPSIITSTSKDGPTRRGLGFAMKPAIKTEILESSTYNDIDSAEDTSQLDSTCSNTGEIRKAIVTASGDGSLSSQLPNKTAGTNLNRQTQIRLTPMSHKKEKLLLGSLEELVAQGVKFDQRELRFLNKLRMRHVKREKGLRIFDLDKEVSRLSTGADNDSDIMHAMLDRFVHTNVIAATSVSMVVADGGNIRFATKLLGSEASWSKLNGFRSPYTQRFLKPFIFRDINPDYPRIKLLQEIHSHPLSAACRHAGGEIAYEILSVDLVYIRPEHIAVINSICRSFFWAGIDMTDQLNYPEFSVVALYGKLIIGFACMAPLANCNEAYLSFLWTHPHFRRRGLARCMLYHLSQSCMGRDIVLHVAATNPAVFLYQSFKFRVEKVCLHFYDKYLSLPVGRKDGRSSNSQTSKEGRHALYMRLKW